MFLFFVFVFLCFCVFVCLFCVCGLYGPVCVEGTSLRKDLI